MERKELKEVAKLLGIKHQPNVKTNKLVKMIDEAMDSLNAELELNRGVAAALETKPADNAVQHSKTFAGYHPISGKEIWK